jgi:hypothetical protein
MAKPTSDFFILLSSRASPHTRQVPGHPVGAGTRALAFLGPAVLSTQLVKDLGVVN